MNQGWRTPCLCEAQRLGARSGEYAWIREVTLGPPGQVWVLARTVIPQQTLRGRYRRLRFLGQRPLGDVLFSEPTVQRCELEIGCIHQPSLPSPYASEMPLWGRRSLLRIHNHPLLIYEWFLSALLMPPAGSQPSETGARSDT